MEEQKTLLGSIATLQVEVTLSKKSIRETALTAIAAAVLILVLTKLITKHI